MSDTRCDKFLNIVYEVLFYLYCSPITLTRQIKKNSVNVLWQTFLTRTPDSTGLHELIIFRLFRNKRAYRGTVESCYTWQSLARRICWSREAVKMQRLGRARLAPPMQHIVRHCLVFRALTALFSTSSRPAIVAWFDMACSSH